MFFLKRPVNISAVNKIPPKFSSDLHGSRSFNLIGIEFSNNPIVNQIKDIHATLEDNVNMVSISKIRDYLNEELAQIDECVKTIMVD